MDQSSRFTSFVLGLIMVTAIVAGKYFNSPRIFLLIVILISIVYYKSIDKNTKIYNGCEDSLIGVAKLIIISGIIGYLIVRIIGIFIIGFN